MAEATRSDHGIANEFAGVTCEHCKGFEATCLAPDGDGAIAACWVCAHFLSEHGGDGDQCVGCTREDVYPAHVIAEQDRARKLRRVRA